MQSASRVSPNAAAGSTYRGAESAVADAERKSAGRRGAASRKEAETSGAKAVAAGNGKAGSDSMSIGVILGFPPAVAE